MKSIGKIVGAVLTLVIGIGVIVLAFKLISGAIGLLGGLLDTVLGIVVIAALIAIVIWMFSYAKKH